MYYWSYSITGQCQAIGVAFLVSILYYHTCKQWCIGPQYCIVSSVYCGHYC